MATGATEEIEEKKLSKLVRLVEKTEDFAFLIGAGTSRPKPAGIPTAGELVERWQTECYGFVDTDLSREEWAKQQEKENDVEESEQYGYWFERTYPDPRARRQEIEELVEGARVTPGQIILASLMSEGGEENYVPVTLTPNFDDLLLDAFHLYLGERPHLINHRVMAPEFTLTRDDPTVVKIHGDYNHLNLQNTTDETNNLEDGMNEILEQTANEYGLVVVGYGGSDESIMSVLRETDLSNYGIYWCVREPDEESKSVTDKLSPRAKTLLSETDSYVVPIDGFVPMMIEFADNIPDIELPSEEELVERAKERSERLEEIIEDRREADTTDAEEEYLEKSELADKAIEAYENEEYQECVELCTRILEIDDSPGAYATRGAAKRSLGEYEAAIEDFNRAIELDPDKALAYAGRGNAKQNLGKYEAAIEDFNRAIELDPDKALAYAGRGNAKQSLSKYEAAIEDYSRAIELDPDKALAYYNRGNAKRNLGEYEAAIEDYSRAIELDSDNAAAYYNRGNAKRNLGKHEAAIEDYDQAIELNLDDAVAYYNRGLAKRNLGEYEAAIEDYNRAIELDPDYAAAYSNRGIAKRNLGEYEAAIEDYDQAIELNSDDVFAFLNRAEARIEIGEPNDAKSDAIEARKLSESTDQEAKSLMLSLIATTLLEEDTQPEEREYRTLCEQEFTTSWNFTQLDEWLADADLDAAKHERITEYIDLLREHEPDA